jgi:hypothetical protein
MSANPDEETGVLLGRYRVIRTLGKGGFGTTWAATDQQTGEAVAIKALDLSRVDDWKAVELFEREAHTLEQLDHPNIPDYLDFVPVRDQDTGYLVQTLAPGTPLHDLLERQGRFTDEQLEGIAERTLELLVYLESLNPAVVHRDIKPSNLILDDDGEVYLVDFGAVQDAAKRTAEGGSTVAGTFGYMAPEQLHGTASPRSDLYALGMTLIHLASGRHPSDLERQGLKVDFHDAVSLSPALEDFIDRLVEPNPDDRFGSAQEALAHLREEVPISPNLTQLPAGPSIAETVLAKEREEAERRRREEEQKRRAAEERRRAIEKRSDRVTVQMNDEELHIRIAPRRGPTAMMVLGWGAFAFVNPGFAIAGGFPFLGQFWPVFADNWLARWIIWGLFVTVACVTGIIAMTPPRHIRLSNEGFFTAYGRNAKKPDEAGRFKNFSVELRAPDYDQAPDAVEITLTDEREGTVFHERLEHLSARDIEMLDELPTKWLGEAEEVVLEMGEPLVGTSMTEDSEEPVAHVIEQ